MRLGGMDRSAISGLFESEGIQQMTSQEETGLPGSKLPRGNHLFSPTPVVAKVLISTGRLEAKTPKFLRGLFFVLCASDLRPLCLVLIP
ncbi:hypothetical protein SAMN05444321_7712 [Bradyrhizobium lablabi]|nr:hypothetical protein SAMN05444321_7712 [Bradyrhizobium lablabi]